MEQPTPPARFTEAFDSLGRLARHERYLGAFVFGSVARGQATAESDLDARVLVDQDNGCPNINHPVIGGVKLDITFVSLRQLRQDTEREIATATRIPMLAESLIVFDKTGALRELRERARVAAPRRAAPTGYQQLRFLVNHAHNKVERAIKSDPAAALLAMHLGLADLLDIERWLAGRWEVSSKRLLPELRIVDSQLADLLERFVATADLDHKFCLWQELVAQIARPLPGWADANNICDCAVCRDDLAALVRDHPSPDPNDG